MGSRGIHASILLLLGIFFFFFFCKTPFVYTISWFLFFTHPQLLLIATLYDTHLFLSLLHCKCSRLCSTNVLYILQYKLLFYNLYPFKQVDTMPTPLIIVLCDVISCQCDNNKKIGQFLLVEPPWQSWFSVTCSGIQKVACWLRISCVDPPDSDLCSTLPRSKCIQFNLTV